MRHCGVWRGIELIVLLRGPVLDGRVLMEFRDC